MSFKSNAIHGISVSNPISEKPSRKLPFTLSWSHYILLLTIKETAERKFYEIESTNESWSVPELRHQKASWGFIRQTRHSYSRTSNFKWVRQLVTIYFIKNHEVI